MIPELDTGITECPCSGHTRHYCNGSDAQVHVRLEAIVQRLGREANGASVARLSRSPVEEAEYEERVLCPLVQHLSDHLE